MNIMSNFKERLNDLMVEEQIKSDQLGKAIGVSSQSIRAWCDDSQSIFLSNVIKLADYFHCSIDYLVGISDSTAEFVAKQYSPFYERLRQVMEEKSKTRYRMTKDSKIKDSYFTTWKNGSDPHILSVIEVAKYLDVTIDYLIGREK